jgi:hypothetical protein
MDVARSAEIFVTIYQSHSVTYKKIATFSHRREDLIPHDSRVSGLNLGTHMFNRGWFTLRLPKLIIVDHAIIYRWKGNFASIYLGRYEDTSVTEDGEIRFPSFGDRGRHNSPCFYTLFRHIECGITAWRKWSEPGRQAWIIFAKCTLLTSFIYIRMYILHNSVPNWDVAQCKISPTLMPVTFVSVLFIRKEILTTNW